MATSRLDIAENVKGPGYERIYAHELDVLVTLTQSFKLGQELHWPVVRASKVHAVWADFVKHGVVRDEKALHEIGDSMLESLAHLLVANVVSGHTERDPGEYVEDLLEPNQVEPFCNWLINDESGHWRISDYGTAPLTQALALAFEAKRPEQKLKYLDRTLHVTHMRGDLSRLFIEGGRGTVLDLEALNPDNSA